MRMASNYEEGRFVKNDSHRLPTKLWMNRPLPRAGEVPTRSRNRRRAAHHQTVVNDLCDIVADLFIAESRLLKPVWRV
jgi:hypothetical protein